MNANTFSIAACLVCIWLCCFTEPLDATLCDRGSLPCTDGSCIKRDQWCDGFYDCPDESDEKYCRETGWRNAYSSDPNSCSDTHFLCGDGKCFPTVVKCDGMQDCEDASDEKDCGEDRKDYESKSRDTDRPETHRKHLEPQPTAEKAAQSNTKEKPHASQRENYQQPGTERTATEDHRYLHRETGVLSTPEPDRQPVHHRPSPRLESSTAAAVYGIPGPTIRRGRLAPTHTRPTSESLRTAQQWLLDQRDGTFGWGKDTPRALVALSLSERGRFFHKEVDTARMKKQLQVLLAVDLMRNNSQVMSLNRLSLYINALLASCQNPRDFHDRDLVNILRERTTSANIQKSQGKNVFINPLVYLTLCLVDETTQEDVYRLRETIFPGHNEQKWLDMQAISITAYSCVAKISRFVATCKQSLNDAVNYLIGRMGEDGNFGNVYSSGLAVQALLSAGATDRWNPTSSIEFLKSHQSSDGSFGDLLATYYVLPVLAGKSLTALKDVLCERTGTDDGLSIESMRRRKGPMHYVRYSLHFGDPVQATNSKTLLVPVNSTFLDIMGLAAEMDLKFRFQQEQEGSDVTVYSISNVPNDAQRGIYWQLYTDAKNQVPFEDDLRVSNFQPYNRGIQHLVPNAGDHIVFWYRPTLK